MKESTAAKIRKIKDEKKIAAYNTGKAEERQRILDIIEGRFSRFGIETNLTQKELGAVRQEQYELIKLIKEEKEKVK